MAAATFLHYTFRKLDSGIFALVPGVMLDQNVLTKDFISLSFRFRSMRLLEELLRQMVQASKNIGNVELENKFSEAIKLLKRDIVFAASLYL